MGTPVHAQEGADSKYVTALYKYVQTFSTVGRMSLYTCSRSLMLAVEGKFV